MHIDMYTVLIQGGVSAVLLAAMFLLYWVRDRRSTWLLWWSIPFICIAFAAFAFTQWTDEPALLPVGLGNVALLLTFGFVWQAARIFEGRKSLWFVPIAVAIGWLALCLWPVFWESLALRVVVASLVVGAFCLLAAYELWRNRAEHLSSRIPAIVVLMATGVLFLARVPLLNVLPFPFGALPLDPLAQSILNLMLFALAISLTILTISMTRERGEQEQRHFAMTDPLTGLLNRRAMLSNAERMLRRHKVTDTPVALLVLDLDHFKTVNDRFGHDAGDRVLVRFAALLGANVRPTDQVYRLGGEEFCCMLPGITAEKALAVAGRICTELETAQIAVPGGAVRVTVSVGVASTEDAGYEFDELLAAADAAVYEAKARGRNMALRGEMGRRA